MYQSQRLQRLFSDVAQRMQISCSLPFPDVPLPHNLRVSSVTPQLLACINAANKVHDICAKMDLHRDHPHDSDTTDDTWTLAHEKQARAWAEDALNRVRDVVTKHKLSVDKTEKKRRPAFNHEYTPLLDKYFEFNAYPSAPDRLMLARKSGMTARQIEVWFQNHRNRAKKEGKQLRKLSETSLPSKLPLESLECTMSFFTIPEHERKTPSTIDKSCEEECYDDEDQLPKPSSSAPVLDILDPPRPDHAFPAKYYPKTDPWSTSSSNYRFSPPVWLRRPTTVRPPVKTHVNIEEFILNFGQKLHLRAPVSKRARPTTAESWCAFRVTTLLPAPHPALIRSHILSSLPHHSPALAVSPNSSFSIPPMNYSAPLTSTSSTQPFVIPNKHAQREISRIPKRTTSNTNSGHRYRSPELPPDPTVVTSRAWSYGSGAVSVRSPSASSSSSSASSSGPTTPVMPYLDLADTFSTIPHCQQTSNFFAPNESISSFKSCVPLTQPAPSPHSL